MTASSDENPSARFFISQREHPDGASRGQRKAFLLKHVEGRSYEEMAELLDTGVGALKLRVMRAREALQAYLKGVV